MKKLFIVGILVWKTAIFRSLEDTATLLNCLPIDRAISAKVIPYQSSIDPAPPTGYYAVQYLEEKDSNEADKCVTETIGY